MTPLKKGRFVFNPDSIKRVREQLGLSQEKLAQSIGVAKTAVSRWEKGQVTPDANSLAVIYSVAKEDRIEPMFFKEAGPKVNKARSRLIVSWDFQNLPLSWVDVEEQSKVIKDQLVKKFPEVSYSLYKVFTSPQHSIAYNGLREQDWRIQEYNYNIDEELDTQSWSDCNHAPDDTIFVLITRDRDYVELIQELRKKGVMVFLIAPADGSQRLIETVGKRRLIPFPKKDFFFPALY